MPDRRSGRIVTLGACNEESAALQAGVELQPYGPVLVRGLPGPPRPSIPSGGYG
jgi:hypothetical protein